MHVSAYMLGAGDATVVSCDDSFTYSFTLDSNGLIERVTVGDILPACGQGSLTLKLTNSSNAVVGSGSGLVPSAGGSLSLSISSPRPAPSDVFRENVLIVGP